MDPSQRARALFGLAERAARLGNLDQAVALAHEIADRDQRVQALSVVAQAASAGNLDRAVALAEEITDPYYREMRSLVWLEWW